jgi:2-phospho-L-lactate/phosphoenolpyruvate guanylyltransferase
MSVWTAIIPVKPWRIAKSRLALPIGLRAALSQAFLLDVLEAVASAAGIDAIVIISAENGVAPVAERYGAVLICEPPSGGFGMLNRSIGVARDWARANTSSASLVVVPSDLPSLTAGSVSDALDVLGEHHRAFVPDAGGHGTTLLSALRDGLLEPSFGPHSAFEHLHSGHREVTAVDPRVRRDVDYLPDLTEAEALGVGRHTARTLERAQLPILEIRDRSCLETIRAESKEI